MRILTKILLMSRWVRHRPRELGMKCRKINFLVFYHRKNPEKFKHLSLCLQFIISFIVASMIKILLNGRFHQIRKAFHSEISKEDKIKQ